MSYNISSSEYISGKLTLGILDFYSLKELYKNELPEGSFLNDYNSKYILNFLDSEVEINQFWWYGEGSRYSLGILKDKILPLTRGEADILFVWEGGESFSGLRVKDGLVTEKVVRFELY